MYGLCSMDPSCLVMNVLACLGCLVIVLKFVLRGLRMEQVLESEQLIHIDRQSVIATSQS